MNPMEIMQIFNQLKSNPNPMVLMQQMYGNNPMFQQALNMAKGKSPTELQQTLMKRNSPYIPRSIEKTINC